VHVAPGDLDCEGTQSVDEIKIRIGKKWQEYVVPPFVFIQD
jgi:hypothetical protein